MHTTEHTTVVLTHASLVKRRKVHCTNISSHTLKVFCQELDPLLPQSGDKGQDCLRSPLYSPPHLLVSNFDWFVQHFSRFWTLGHVFQAWCTLSA